MLHLEYAVAVLTTDVDVVIALEIQTKHFLKPHKQCCLIVPGKQKSHMGFADVCGEMHNNESVLTEVVLQDSAGVDGSHVSGKI